MTDFVDYINHYGKKKFDSGSMWVPGLYVEQAQLTWTPLKENAPVDSRSILELAEDRDCKFPEGYCAFLETLGPGMWAGMGIPAPQDTYAFDEGTGPMKGFVTVACNVNGMGDHLAFNPQEGQKIYFCGHDPFGYAQAGSSFEEVITKVTQCALSDGTNGVNKFFETLPFHEVAADESAMNLAATKSFAAVSPKSSAADPATKPWWQFW